MYHKTAEGKTMLIAQMEQSHLVNTINLIITKVKESKEILNNDIAMKSSLDFVMGGISPQKIKDRAEEAIKRNLKHLPYYIFEACIRGLSYTNELQGLYGRESAVGQSDLYLSNNSYDDYDHDDDYDLHD